MAASSLELHFFPASEVLALYRVTGQGKAGKRVLLFRADAKGGPPGAIPDPRMPQTPTTPGTFVIDRVEAYRTSTWPMSMIRWGTPLQDRPAIDDILYKLPSGQWGSVTKDIKVTRDFIRAEFARLYGKYDVPSTWVFNDFGPLAVRYYKDLNHNRVLDGRERLMGEMIHTTPADEARSLRRLPFRLQTSHGCIHVRPLERDSLQTRGAFRRGVTFVVHSYGERLP